MASFRYQNLKGSIAKTLVQGLVEDAGYRVYPYGYESQLSQIRYDVRGQSASNSDSVMRLRSSPDLLVYDSRVGSLYFTETKFRRVDNPYDVALRSDHIRNYRKYWSDSLLIVVIPVEHVFYAQFVKDLKISEGSVANAWMSFDLTKDFMPIDAVFRGVTSELLEQYRKDLERISIMQADMNEGNGLTEDEVDYYMGINDYNEIYGRRLK